jgi:glycosyltransferase involved in cell wall biosynthesis
MTTEWICCQLGAREHYAVPRALLRYQRLRAMITDAWTRPGNPIAHMPNELARRLSERFHPDLAASDVYDLTLSLLAREVEWLLQRKRDWDLVIARNEWFQRKASAIVRALDVPPSQRIAVFAHSYAAREVFRAARDRGWTTVLGQIDPGEEHFTIVRRLSDAAPQFGPPPALPPIAYFESWREECELADHIVVNSEWSRQAIVRAGVNETKVRVQALAYESEEADVPSRVYPSRFTDERPLRLLFVGTVAVVKGVPALLDAMALLRGQPVTLTLVGPEAMVIPDADRRDGIVIAGPVTRSEVFRHYYASDVLVFPSHSDGFGMAQIEAQSTGLPVIASKHCGEVVEQGVTGTLLPSVCSADIAAAVRCLLEAPATLARFSAAALRANRPSLSNLGEGLVRLVRA